MQAFRSTVLNASGWSFVDEGGPGKRKWGYISSKPDSLLTIKVRSRPAAFLQAADSNRRISKVIHASLPLS
jgi:hypothetical protein